MLSDSLKEERVGPLACGLDIGHSRANLMLRSGGGGGTIYLSLPRAILILATRKADPQKKNQEETLLLCMQKHMARHTYLFALLDCVSCSSILHAFWSPFYATMTAASLECLRKEIIKKRHSRRLDECLRWLGARKEHGTAEGSGRRLYKSANSHARFPL